MAVRFLVSLIKYFFSGILEATNREDESELRHTRVKHNNEGTDINKISESRGIPKPKCLERDCYTKCTTPAQSEYRTLAASEPVGCANHYTTLSLARHLREYIFRCYVTIPLLLRWLVFDVTPIHPLGKAGWGLDANSAV